MSTQTKKKSEKLWHSTVASAEGGIAMLLKSEVKDGKFGPYCFVRCHGEEDDRLFSLDSTKARAEYERVRGKVGAEAWVVCEAAGAKESATLFFKDANGNPIMDDQAAQPDDAPFPPTPFEKPQNAPQQPSSPSEDSGVPPMTAGYYECLKAARAATEQFREVYGDRPTNEEMRIATTLYIQMH